MSNFSVLVNGVFDIGGMAKIEHVDRTDLTKVVVKANFIPTGESGEEVFYRIKTEVEKSVPGRGLGRITFSDMPGWDFPFESWEGKREGVKDDRANITLTFHNPLGCYLSKDKVIVDVGAQQMDRDGYIVTNEGSAPVTPDAKITIVNPTNDIRVATHNGDRQWSFLGVPAENLQARNIENNVSLAKYTGTVVNPYPKVRWAGEGIAERMSVFYPNLSVPQAYNDEKDGIRSAGGFGALPRPSSDLYYGIGLSFGLSPSNGKWTDETYYETLYKKRILDTMEGRAVVMLVDEAGKVFAGFEINRVARGQVNMDFIFDGGIHQTVQRTDRTNPFSSPAVLSFDVKNTTVSIGIPGQTVTRNIPALAGRKVSYIYSYAYTRNFDFNGKYSSPFFIRSSQDSGKTANIRDWRLEGGGLRFKTGDIIDIVGNETRVNGRLVNRDTAHPSPLLEVGASKVSITASNGGSAKVELIYNEVLR